jgi:hypothetical protein
MKTVILKVVVPDDAEIKVIGIQKGKFAIEAKITEIHLPTAAEIEKEFPSKDIKYNDQLVNGWKQDGVKWLLNKLTDEK